MEALTLLGPQSRFGDKLLIVRGFCPHIWECGSKRVKFAQGCDRFSARDFSRTARLRFCQNTEQGVFGKKTGFGREFPIRRVSVGSPSLHAQ